MGIAPVAVELHCLSGTGGTWLLAERFAQAARERGMAAAVTPVRRVVPSGERPEPGTLVGLLSPTHGLTAPWGAIRYAMRMPGVRGRAAFVVTTRAGWYLGPWRLPGFEGTAAWLLALVLAVRGARIVGVRAIDMPSNWTALHWGMNAVHVSEIVRHGRVRLDDYAAQLLSGDTSYGGRSVFVLGCLLSPVSLVYLLIGSRLLGKLFLVDERCTSCGLCEKHCPFDAVSLRGPGRGKPYWSYRCESCMRCMNICPERAIQASWPWAVGMSALVLIPVGAALALALGLAGPLARVVDVAAQYVWALSVAAVGYAGLWVMALWLPVAWAVGHATPTRLFRRYRATGVDLRRI